MARESNSERMAILETKLDALTDSFEELKVMLNDNNKKFVRREEFNAVKRLVYGAISFIGSALIAILGWISVSI